MDLGIGDSRTERLTEDIRMDRDDASYFSFLFSDRLEIFGIEGPSEYTDQCGDDLVGSRCFEHVIEDGFCPSSIAREDRI